MKQVFLILTALVGLITTKAFAAPDLTAYHLTFDEEFDKEPNLSILSPGYGWGPISPGVKWIVHTPWSGDFGSAYFTGPHESSGDGTNVVPPDPFSLYPHLVITAYYDANINHWRSGIIASCDAHGNGFYQSLGYWETKLWLPSGKGVWPAFFLGDRNGLLVKPRTTNAAEIDIMEMYGVDMTKLHQRTHVWSPSGQDVGTPGAGTTVTISDPTTGWHVFGCLIDPQLTHFYFDGVETFSTPTQAAFMDPLFVMVDLALGGGWPIDLPGPVNLGVAYIRCYSR